MGCAAKACASNSEGLIAGSSAPKEGKSVVKNRTMHLRR